MSKIKLNIKDNIAETLLITLYAKACESKKKNPLIIDQLACELVEKIDYDFSKYKNKKLSSVGVAIRASHFDNMIKRFILRKNNPIVVLIGCGLDARIQRLGKIADKAVFYELDLEEVIELRKNLMPQVKNENYIASSMLDTKWMDSIKDRHPKGNFIFIIEGVLMYFDEKDNKFIFSELAERFKNAEIHFDMLNKRLANKAKIHDTVKFTNANFKFGIESDKEIENWNRNLKHIKTYLFSNFKGYKRMGITFALLMKFIPLFKNSSKLMVYEIK